MKTFNIKTNKLFLMLYSVVLVTMVFFFYLYTKSIHKQFVEKVHGEILYVSYHINNDLSDSYRHDGLLSLKSKMDSYINTSDSLKNIHIYENDKLPILTTSRESYTIDIENTPYVHLSKGKDIVKAKFLKSFLFNYTKQINTYIIFELNHDYLQAYMYEMVYEKILFLFFSFVFIFIFGSLFVRNFFSQPLQKFIELLESKHLLDAEKNFVVSEFNLLLEKVQNFNKATINAKERFELAIESTDDGVWDWEIDKDKIYFSRKYIEMLGYKNDEFPNDSKMFFESVHKDDKALVESELKKHLKDPVNHKYSLEIRMLCKDSTYKWILVRGKASLNEDGTPHRMLGSHTDISTQKNLELMLREQRNFNQSLLQEANSVVAVIDKDGVMLELNPYGVSFVGYTKEEVASSPYFWSRFLPEDIKEEVFDIIKNAKNGEITKRFQNSWISKSGEERVFEWSNALIVDENNEMQYLTTIGIDITELKEQEKMLLQEKNRVSELSKEQKTLLSLFDKGESVLFQWKNDAEWSIEYVSENVEKLFSYSHSEFITNKIKYASCIHKDDINIVMEDVLKAVEENADFFKHEPYRIITKDNQVRWVLDYTVTTKDEEGNIINFIGYINDITESKENEIVLEKAKEEAVKISQAKSDFLANMSHEIRTPLNGILGLTDLVLDTKLNSVQREYLEKAKDSSSALLHVINDILDYSKIEAGKLILENKPFKLSTIIKTIESLFEFQANTKGIELNITSSEAKMYIGDSLRITQILTNLVGNAIKFTKKGRVDIEVKVIEDLNKKQKLKFSVQDTGIGISKDVQKNLFDEFSQADGSITREFGGTGLGLAITKQLVGLMGGNIWVKSTEGEGSEFAFSIVLDTIDDEKNVKVEKEKDCIDTSKIKNAKVLVVEDNKVNQIVTRGLLENIELNVEISDNGLKAVNRIESGEYFDLILMDLQMPVMDGYEASKQIKSINPDIPIFALSAAVMEEDLLRVIESKMEGHLSKPIDNEKLYEVLAKYIHLDSNLGDKNPMEKPKTIEVHNKFEGIDFESLSEKLGNNEKILANVLENFCNTYENVEEVFDISKQGTKLFMNNIHSLKGMSGNMSLNDVFKLSSQIYEEKDIDKISILTPQLIELLHENIKYLKLHLNDLNLGETIKETMVYSKDEILNTLEEIQRDAQSFKLISQDRLEIFKDMLFKDIQKKTVNELNRYLLEYKYKEADLLLSKIKTILLEK